MGFPYKYEDFFRRTSNIERPTSNSEWFYIEQPATSNGLFAYYAFMLPASTREA
jgi:hypothetical protein